MQANQLIRRCKGRNVNISNFIANCEKVGLLAVRNNNESPYERYIPALPRDIAMGGYLLANNKKTHKYLFITDILVKVDCDMPVSIHITYGTPSNILKLGPIAFKEGLNRIPFITKLTPLPCHEMNPRIEFMIDNEYYNPLVIYTKAIFVSNPDCLMVKAMRQMSGYYVHFANDKLVTVENGSIQIKEFTRADKEQESFAVLSKYLVPIIIDFLYRPDAELVARASERFKKAYKEISC